MVLKVDRKDADPVPAQHPLHCLHNSFGVTQVFSREISVDDVDRLRLDWPVCLLSDNNIVEALAQLWIERK